jgi:hypothetical protein
MFKIQLVIFSVIGTIAGDNLVNIGHRSSVSNTWPLDLMDRHSHSVNKSRSHLLAIDSTEIIVRVGNIIKDTASTNEIIANRGLRIILKGYPGDFKIAVLSFDITTVNKNRDTLAANVGARGNFLSKDQITELRKLNGSGKITFHSIRAVGVSGTVRELPPFSLIVRG